MRSFPAKVTALRLMVRFECSLCSQDNEVIGVWSGIDTVGGMEVITSICTGCQRETRIYPVEVNTTDSYGENYEGYADISTR